MIRYLTITLLFFIFSPNQLFAGSDDYTQYHREVLEAERLICNEKFHEALQVYENLFRQYDFIFLKEYQIATQLAVYLGDLDKAFQLLEKAILAGWHKKSIRKNQFLKPLFEDPKWKVLQKKYPDLRKRYESSFNSDLQKQVKKMFSKDQWKAFGALFTLSSEAQDRYAEKRFAPHSEKQLAELMRILDKYGYPGERLVGNNYWASTILSHHNSISQAYNQKDSLYRKIRPKLEAALRNGQISPFEMALIDEWSRSTLNTKPAYGILDPPTREDLPGTNSLRAEIFFRSIEIRNKLVDIQEKTGLNFYLQGYPWIDGKVEVR